MSHFEYTTVLACGNAAGDILSPMIIYRNLPETIPNTFMSRDGPLYKSSKTGWINTALFNEWFINIFLKESRTLITDDYNGPIILIFDGHSTHLSDELIELAQQHYVILLKLPSHTTHVMQPLDVNFFGPLKNVLGRIIRENYIGNVAPKLGKDKFAEYLKAAWNHIDCLLKRGFIQTGICTENGVNVNAIGDEQIIISQTINDAYKSGLFTEELSKEYVVDLAFPVEESRIEKITKQLMTMRQTETDAPKRKISKYIQI
jgi:hypothetical protein